METPVCLWVIGREQEETQDISRGSGGEVFSTLLQDLPPIGQSQVVISEGGKIPGNQQEKP